MSEQVSGCLTRRSFLAAVGVISLAGCVSGPDVDWKFKLNGKPGEEGATLKAIHDGGETIDNTDGRTLKVKIDSLDDETRSGYPAKKYRKGDYFTIDISNIKKSDEVIIMYYTYSDNGHYGTSIARWSLE